MRPGNFITRQSEVILENKQYAILCAALLSVLPFATWLSVAVVALVTLRKGAKVGFEILLPACIIHSVPLMMLVPVTSALINALVAYVPCYLAAISLRQTVNWQMVFATFLAQALVAFLLINLLIPDFVMDQLLQLKKIIGQYDEYQQLIGVALQQLSPDVLAHLFFGFQILSVIISSMISMMFARSLQARLFMPGGFANELMEFKANKLSCFILATTVTLAYIKIPVALNIIPLVLAYFLLAGLCLTYYILMQKRQRKLGLLLCLLTVFKPMFMLLTCMAVGVLDGLFNFRLYLHTG